MGSSAQPHAGVTMVVSNMIQSAAAASWMRPSQLATLLVWCVAGRRCAVPTCQRPKVKVQRMRKLMQQRKPNEVFDRADVKMEAAHGTRSVVLDFANLFF